MLSLFRYFGVVLALLGAALAVPAVPAVAQQDNHIAADLVAEHAPEAGETLYVALRFRPEQGWHGYWANPGDAGLGMELDWELPEGWQAGEPLYPVPHKLVLLGIMNHVYEDPYAVLVPIEIAPGAATANFGAPAVDARWLACSDQLCVTEGARLTLRFPQETEALREQFDADRAAIPPLIDQQAQIALTGDLLRLAIPLPASVALPDPHVFIVQQDLIDYGAEQVFYRDGDLLVAEVPRGGLRADATSIEGILSFGNDGQGVRFTAETGEVPTGGTRIANRALETPLLLLLGGALLGGLLLNLMPCVFPILSLKALTLARAGGEERQARIEALAYTAGVVLACLALGAIMLVLRAGGTQVGWAFQLQEPLVVATLLVLALVITANFIGFFEVPSLPIRSRGQGGAFVTGLLAAVVATPCTGPFMAAALGAALLLPAPQAMLLFGTLGLGLALPFLLLGFVPVLRRMLPKPGAWMETFRRIMAVPMGLTALALVWLLWRMGGTMFAATTAMLAVALTVAVVAFLRQPRNTAWTIIGASQVVIAAGLGFQAHTRFDPAAASAESLLDPVPYSEAALAEARVAGQPVFLWFTADWCLTCKVNEQVAIERESTREAFEEAGVLAMRGDWTRNDPEITRYLEAQGAAGVPLYMWYPAGGDGEQLPQVLTPDMLAGLAAQAD